MRLVKAAMAEASKQTTLPKRMQLRNVMIGQSLVTAPLELPYATPAAAGKYRLLSSYFSLTCLGRKQTRSNENGNCISGSTKYDRCAYRSSTQTFRERSVHFRIERISSRSWNDDWKLSSSR